MVTFAVLGVIATAVLTLTIQAFGDTATIVDRRDVFADGRVALDRLSKQLRQAESIDTAWSTTQRIRFEAYIDGVPTTFAWQVAGAGAPYALQESRDGGTTFSTVVSSLADADVFTVTQHGGVVDQVTLSLDLRTETSDVLLTSDVFLRNA
jgi:hypothetical protein